MASKIKILDERTINQIAAGEVIENPASVVKELVDNALDAGSTEIVVEAVNSGRQLIRVQDNGFGIDHDDLLLSIERHATSKISCLEDLWELQTMGFRGEALSSIASISEFQIRSKPAGRAEGSMLSVAGGKIISHEICKGLPGTTVEVKNLFYNVPARRKFLKSPVKDGESIKKVLIQLALCYPDISFELILNHAKEFSWRAKNVDERIKDVLGDAFYNELVPVSFENEEIRITGFVAKPLFSRPTRAYQYLFVNKRPVTSLPISHAVKEAYGSSIEEKRHPAFVLYVEVKPASLDVNVHPQKREVRFSIEQQIKEAVIQAVTASLFMRNVKEAPAIMPMSYKQQPVYETGQKIAEPFRFPEPTFEPITFIESSIHIYKVLGDFIIADIDGDFSAVSTKRALSRLTHDGSSSGIDVKPSVQTLLVPIFLEMQKEEAAHLRAIIQPLEKAGFHITDFGPASFLIQAHPSYLEGVPVEELVRALVEKEVSGEDIAKELSNSCKKMSCSYKISKESAHHILKKLMQSSNPYVCPAGDAIISTFTPQELEKKFL